MASSGASEDGQVPLTSLPIQDLGALKQQFEAEIQNLMANYQSLRVAQSQFGASKTAIQKFSGSQEGAEMLIPLTEALYVPAKVKTNKKVLVEYGAGYYVERSCKDAQGFFDRKVKFLSDRTSQLEQTIRTKREQLAQVIQVYQAKVKMQAEANAKQAGNA